MIAYMFPGQGSQEKGMGGTLFDQFPEIMKKADNILGYSLKELCLNGPQEKLNQTQHTQPALYVVNALSYQQKLIEVGRTPHFLVGHSLGEYNALEAAGVFSFENGLKLVKRRGELMSEADKGAMAAIVGMSEEDIRNTLERNDLSRIDIANYNSPTQVVISGLEEDIRMAQLLFEKEDVMFILLNTSGAFHSRYMKPAKSKFERYLKKFKFSALKIPVISNVNAHPYNDDAIVSNLSDQITHSVKWSESIRYLMGQGKMEFEEVGVGNVLTKLITSIQQQAKPLVIEEEAILQYKRESSSEKGGMVSAVESLPKNTSVTTEDLLAQGDETSGLSRQERRDREIEALHKKIDDWNRTYPPGVKVQVEGYVNELETRTKAMILFGHRGAIYMKGYDGYFALDDVTPLVEVF